MGPEVTATRTKCTGPWGGGEASWTQETAETSGWHRERGAEGSRLESERLCPWSLGSAAPGVHR